jgi:CTP synthase
MQMAVIEYARNVLNLKNANTQEVDPKTRYPVIHIMDNQKQFLKNKQYGGTIRLGAWPCQIKTGTIIENAYKKYGGSLNNPWYERNNNIFSSAQPKKAALVYERHRHRYEFNNKYKKRFEEKGFVISGTSPDGMLVEAIELKDHPFFVGTQFHPEYESRPLTPHPIFVSFVEAVKKRGVPA